MNPPPPVKKGLLRHRSGASFDDIENPIVLPYNPATVEVTNGANWVKHQIPFVHHPRLQYAGGNGRQVSFDVHLLADDPLRGKKLDVDALIAILESLAYPDASGEALGQREPARLTLVLGASSIAMNCVLTDSVTSHRLFYNDMSTRYAVMTLTFEEDVVTPISAADRRAR